ncbi:MAG: ribosome small subunit-dependent GTPase A [Armatimonadetes bacterium]|nr:ribosome small subunit-dependent GTPase A [Armatimonadota bacterium]
MILGVVTKVVGGFFFVFHEGRVYRCVARGRLKRSSTAGGPRPSRMVPGDRVQFRPLSMEEGVVEEMLPRDRELTKSAAAGAQRQQVLAANVDQTGVVVAAMSPAPTPQAIDRLLALAEASGLQPLLCINKIDLASTTAWRLLYEEIGYPVYEVSAHTGQGIEALRRGLSGHLTVLVGPSGVGKSSLVNALNPASDRRTGALSKKTDRGRHTTTTAEILPIGDDVFLVDTPGAMVLDFVHLVPEGLRDCFPEFREFRDACAFSNCRHRDEPGCAVLAAVARGEIAASRVDSYHKMLAEAEIAEARRY